MEGTASGLMVIRTSELSALTRGDCWARSRATIQCGRPKRRSVLMPFNGGMNREFPGPPDEPKAAFAPGRLPMIGATRSAVNAGTCRRREGGKP